MIFPEKLLKGNIRAIEMRACVFFLLSSGHADLFNIYISLVELRYEWVGGGRMIGHSPAKRTERKRREGMRSSPLLLLFGEV